MTEERLTFPVFLSYRFPFLTLSFGFSLPVPFLTLHLQFSFLSFLVPSFSRNTPFFPFLPTHLTSFLFIFSFTSLPVIFNFLFFSYKSLPFFSCLPLLLHFHSFPIVLSHLTSFPYLSYFLHFLSLPLLSCSSSHTSLFPLSFLTSLPLSSYFHISLPFLDQLFFGHFFLLPSHLTFFSSFLSFHFLPFSFPLFQSQLTYFTYLFYTYYFLSLPFVFLSYVPILPLLSFSFLFSSYVSHPFPSSFLSFPHLIPHLLFISFLYIIFFPFPSTHLTFFSSTVLLSSHHFLFYALLVSLPASLPCLPHV